ncbi:MAG: hypothetical protein JWM88_3544 [Verrucomicrobia bacterium]|nr:hypothetical protein [Verrucomicrobiota bacterium]
MKHPHIRLLLASSLLSLAIGPVPLRAQAEPTPHLGRAADNKILAQQIVNDLMKSHPELILCGLHAVAPGAEAQTMIASSQDKIGKSDDDDDVAVTKERKMILVPNAKEPNKFEVQVPLQDSGGNVIGACAFVFRYQAGDDEVPLLVKAKQIRDDIAKRLPNRDALFRSI